jgi:hypothetical protein
MSRFRENPLPAERLSREGWLGKGDVVGQRQFIHVRFGCIDSSRPR